MPKNKTNPKKTDAFFSSVEKRLKEELSLFLVLSKFLIIQFISFIVTASTYWK